MCLETGSRSESGLPSARRVHSALGKQHGPLHFDWAVYFDNKTVMLPFERALRLFKDSVV